MLTATTRKCAFRKMGFGGSPVTDGNKGWTPASSGIGVLDYRLKMLPGESSYYRSTQSPFCSDGSWKPGIGSLKVQSQLSQVREAASLEIGSRELWFCDQNATSAVHRQSRHQKRAPHHARRRWHETPARRHAAGTWSVDRQGHLRRASYGAPF